MKKRVPFRRVLLVGLLMAFLIPSSTGASYLRPGLTERVSVTSKGEEAVDPEAFVIGFSSWDTAISADGRYVAFESTATNLAPGDANGVADIFVHDRKTGKTEIVSISSNGSIAVTAVGACVAGSGNGAIGSFDPAISADGRYVNFNSCATNLVPGDTNLASDAFVHDRKTGQTTRVSVSSNGGEANGPSFAGGSSPDGRYIAFSSRATNLVPKDNNNFSDVFVHDMKTGKTEMVSVAKDGTQGNGNSSCGSVSGGGRIIAFSSYATNLTPDGDDDTLYADAFVHDRQTGKTEHIPPIPEGGMPGLGGGSAPCPNGGQSMDTDGRYVLFTSNHDGYIPSDQNNSFDVFVYDRKDDRTDRISVFPDGRESTHQAGTGGMSLSGRFVALWGSGKFFEEDTGANPSTTITIPPRGDGDFDVYVYDMKTKDVDWVSLNSKNEEATGCEAPGAAAYGDSKFPAISRSGRFVAFESCATNLSEDKDTNLAPDIFVRDRGEVVQTIDLRSAGSGAGRVRLDGDSGRPSVVRFGDANDDALISDDPVSSAAEILGAELIYRPESRDLLAWIDVDRLPSIETGPNTSTVAPLPLTYGMSFEVAGQEYELRASQIQGSIGASSFALHRCSAGWICEKVADLTGGIGTTGHSVVISAPLDMLGLGHGGEISALQAFARISEPQLGLGSIGLRSGGSLPTDGVVDRATF